MTAISNPSLQRALPVVINGTLTLVIAWPVAHGLGFAAAIDALMFWAGGGAYVVLCLYYAIVFIALGAGLRGTALLMGLRLLGGNAGIDRLGSWFAARIHAIKTAAAQFLLLTVGLPLRIVWEKGWKPVEDRIAEFLSRMEIERELRKEYRRNYRRIYATFAEFKRAYFGQDEKKETSQTQTPLADAYAVLGLSESCTRKQLDAQYRSLMKKVHPDVGGTPALAAKVNQAKDLIMKEKGWK